MLQIFHELCSFQQAKQIHFALRNILRISKVKKRYLDIFDLCNLSSLSFPPLIMGNEVGSLFYTNYCLKWIVCVLHFTSAF